MRYSWLIWGLVGCGVLFFTACGGGEQEDPESQTAAQEEAPMQLILIGGPGAGKGTQAEKLLEKYDICHISTGQILRDEVAKGTELGQRVAGVMERGELVADSIILRLVENRLQEEACQSGFVLDGFPRTLAQARGLDQILERRGSTNLQVLLLEVSDREITNRLLKRGRADDTAETIRQRIEKFHAETADAIRYYEEKGQLIRINGEQSIEAVAADIEKALSAGQS